MCAFCWFTLHNCITILTYLLTPWCRVLLEKLAGLQLVKKFPAFYGTRRFITAFTSFRHPSLSWASPPIQNSRQNYSWWVCCTWKGSLYCGLTVRYCVCIWECTERENSRIFAVSVAIGLSECNISVSYAKWYVEEKAVEQLIKPNNLMVY